MLAGADLLNQGLDDPPHVHTCAHVHIHTHVCTCTHVYLHTHMHTQVRQLVTCTFRSLGCHWAEVPSTINEPLR